MLFSVPNHSVHTLQPQACGSLCPWALCTGDQHRNDHSLVTQSYCQPETWLTQSKETLADQGVQSPSSRALPSLQPPHHHHHHLCILALVCSSKEEKERKPEIQTAATKSINNTTWWNGLICRHIPEGKRNFKANTRLFLHFYPKSNESESFSV